MSLPTPEQEANRQAQAQHTIKVLEGLKRPIDISIAAGRPDDTLELETVVRLLDQAIKEARHATE